MSSQYRQVVLDDEVDKELKSEIGADQDHVHFLVQSVTTYSATKIV